MHEKDLVACRGVTADARFRVHYVEEDLAGRGSQGAGIQADGPFMGLTLLKDQVRRADAHQGDQRHRDHDQALHPQGPVQLPLPDPACLVRSRRW